MGTYQANYYGPEPGKSGIIVIVTRPDADPRTPGWHQYDLPMRQPTEEDLDALLTTKGWRRMEPWREHGTCTQVERVS